VGRMRIVAQSKTTDHGSENKTCMCCWSRDFGFFNRIPVNDHSGPLRLTDHIHDDNSRQQRIVRGSPSQHPEARRCTANTGNSHQVSISNHTHPEQDSSQSSIGSGTRARTVPGQFRGQNSGAA
jgi:hypothetical protein